MLHDWQVYFWDKNDNPLGLGFRFSQIKIIERFNTLGYWSYGTKETKPLWDMLQAGAYRVNILRDSDIFMSGFIRNINGADDGNESYLEISGVDELFYLHSRIVYPSPDGDFTADDYDQRTGFAETIVKEYVHDHASAGAIVPARRWPKLTIEANLARGDNVTAKGRLQNLLEFCADIFISGGGLGMRVIGDEFQVYEPRDLSAVVVFSGGLVNISSRDYRIDFPSANYVIAGGAGDLMARTFYYANNPVSIGEYGRIELFVDTKNDSGQESADKYLDEGLGQYFISITPNPEDPEFKPYDDYWIGDTITTKVFETDFSNVIRTGSVTIDTNSGTELYEVGLETVRAKNKNPFRTIRLEEKNNSSRISSQERN
jgi:hypothetical protein